MKTSPFFACLLFSFVFSNSIFAQTWTPQNSGTTTSLRDVDFVDELHGWAVGSSGTILKTIDGGSTWISQNSGTLNDLNTVSFVDTLIGWAAGHRLIIHTSDGGSTWEVQSEGGLWIKYNDIIFLNPNIGWVVDRGGLIRHTTDGGLHWTDQPINYGGELYGIDFVDEQTGWVAGGYCNAIVYPDGTIYSFCVRVVFHTTNSGETWGEQFGESTSPAVNGLSLLSVDFIDSQNGWAVSNAGSERVLHTTDGGANWSGSNLGSPRYVGFTDTQNGWLVGNGGFISNTLNGGVTWRDQESGTIFNLNRMDLLSVNHAWCVGDSGTILSYIDSIGIQTGIQINPLTLFFGTVPCGSDFSRLLTIINTGNEPLTINTMTAPPGFQHSFPLPVTVNIGDSVANIITFSPTQGRPYNGDIILTRGLSGSPTRVPVSGIGFLPSTTTTDDASVPTDFFLSQNFPNPFNPKTTISFGVPQASDVTLDIFDALGRQVCVLSTGTHQPGTHSVIWDGSTQSTGMYFARLQSGQHVILRKMLLLK